MICKICNKEIQTLSGLFNHIKTHGISKDEYIEKYDSNVIEYSTCKMCDKQIPKNHIYCGNECKFKDSELNAKRARKEQNDKTKHSECNICKKIYEDTINASGCLTIHLKKEHNIETKDFKQYFTIKDKPEQDYLVCPICNEWKTIDLENKSGWFTTHLKREHDLSIGEFCTLFPEYQKRFWKVFNSNKERIELINISENNYVECKMCGLKVIKLNNTHLNKCSGITEEEYKKRFGEKSLLSEYSLNKLKDNYKISLGLYENTESKSKPEEEIVEYIQSLGITNIKRVDRNILKSGEIDIYLPDYNFAIEHDGLYYHTVRMGKYKSYHLDKTNGCGSKGIYLIHIFGDEWEYKSQILKSKIKHILGKNDNYKIYARKCIIKEIDMREKNRFLAENHIQGMDNSSIKLGAFYNNELIAVITFDKYNVENYYELNRLATSIKYNCVGVCSKLLSYFIKTTIPNTF